MIVQPQDVFATVAGIAGTDVPEGADSHDVLKLAQAGREGRRRIALAGGPASAWGGKDGGALFTAFSDEWWMEVAAKPEHCHLVRYGSLQDESADRPGVVAELHAAALGEVARRGADPVLMAWLRGGGEGDFPQDCRYADTWPGPPNYRPYFSRLYKGD